MDITSDEFCDNNISGGAAQWYKVGSSKPVIATEKESYAEKLLPEKVTRCSLISAGIIDGVCSSDNTISEIGSKLGLEGKSRAEILDAAEHKTGCPDEACVLRKMVDKNIADQEIAINMKIQGPTDTSLMNNFNIDNTLKQWQVKYRDFYPYNFNMRDYERKGDTLATVDLTDLYKQGFRTAACVINSDYYKGAGKHWMALFVDMRAFTVEFFNSSGNPPYAEFVAWLEKSKNQLDSLLCKGSTDVSVDSLNPHKPAEIILCCDLPHQKTKTECGLYSLYYIWARLNGVPADFFKKYIISDILMIGLRQHLFDGTANKSGVTGKGGKGPLGVGDDGKFDIEKYKEKSKIPWENDVDKDTIARSLGGNNNDVKNNDVRGGWYNDQELKKVGANRPNYAEIGCKIGEDIETVTQKLIEAGLLDKSFIYGNLINSREIELKKSTNGGSDNFNLKIDIESAPKLEYRRRKKEPKLSMHSELRCMILDAINGIIEFGKVNGGLDGAGVVYAGEIPEEVVKYVAKMFPGLRHEDDIEDTTPVLLISEINNAVDNDKNVEEEMKKQMQLYKEGNYKCGILRFRLPYCAPGKSKKFTYLDGVLYRSPFGHYTSASSKLFVGEIKQREYDIESYESEQFYHNTIRRIWGYFDHKVIGDGIDHCFDCRAEIEILSKYYADTNLSEEALIRKISTASRELSEVCGSLVHPPHGVCKNIRMEEKFGHLIAKYGDIAGGGKY